MKLKNKIMGLLALSLLAMSCSKELELKDPQNISPQDALASDASIKKILLGAYDAISSSNMYGGNAQLYADLLGSDGELNWVGTFNTYREIWGKNILTTNPNISSIWGAGYNAINLANNVVANLEKVNSADRDRVKGEALFIRGAMHFELVRFFAKDYTDGDPATNPGIPVMTSPVNTLEEITKPARNNVKAV